MKNDSENFASGTVASLIERWRESAAQVRRSAVEPAIGNVLMRCADELEVVWREAAAQLTTLQADNLEMKKTLRASEQSALPEGQDLRAGTETASRVHELKTWPDYYRHLLDGTKTFEYRRDDRGFRIGDVLHLREWEPLAWDAGSPTIGRYTGREMRRRVIYILNASKNFVVMSLESATSDPARVQSSEEHPAIGSATWKERALKAEASLTTLQAAHQTSIQFYEQAIDDLEAQVTTLQAEQDASTFAAEFSAERATQSWAVTVERNGENVVTLSSNGQGGRSLSVEDERVIQMAADHLLGFLGLPSPRRQAEQDAKRQTTTTDAGGGGCVDVCK